MLNTNGIHPTLAAAFNQGPAPMDTIDSQISSLVDELADAKWDDLVSDEDCEEFIARLAALGFKRTSNRLKSYMDNDKKCGGGCANYEADYNDL